MRVFGGYTISLFVIAITWVGNLFLAPLRAVSKSCAHSKSMGKSGVRLPVLRIRVYSHKGSKLVYVLLDSGSEDTLISRTLFNELKLGGIPLDVLLITANGSRNLISTFNTSFKSWPD